MLMRCVRRVLLCCYLVALLIKCWLAGRTGRQQSNGRVLTARRQRVSERVQRVQSKLLAVAKLSSNIEIPKTPLSLLDQHTFTILDATAAPAAPSP